MYYKEKYAKLNNKTDLQQAADFDPFTHTKEEIDEFYKKKYSDAEFDPTTHTKEEVDAYYMKKYSTPAPDPYAKKFSVNGT